MMVGPIGSAYYLAICHWINRLIIGIGVLRWCKWRETALFLPLCTNAERRPATLAIWSDSRFQENRSLHKTDRRFA
jgi:hypothetical protein